MAVGAAWRDGVSGSGCKCVCAGLCDANDDDFDFDLALDGVLLDFAAGEYVGEAMATLPFFLSRSSRRRQAAQQQILRHDGHLHVVS